MSAPEMSPDHCTRAHTLLAQSLVETKGAVGVPNQEFFLAAYQCVLMKDTLVSSRETLGRLTELLAAVKYPPKPELGFWDRLLRWIRRL